MDLPSTLFRRVGQEARKPGGAGAGGNGARDQRLVAHWRFTETFASGGFTQATDYHLVLEADGRMETWSRSQGDAGGSDGERTRGTWKTEGGELWVKGDGESEWGTLGKVSVTDTHLMLTRGGGRKTVYERI
jgi:hypothetical protein